MTESGVPVADAVGDTADPDPDEVHEIDRVLSAEKCGNRYRLWIKWKDYADSTPMWKHELERQSVNPELLREIAEAVQRCRDQLNLSREPEDDPVAEDEEVALPDNEAPPLGRGAPRVRKAPERYSCTLAADPLTAAVLQVVNSAPS